ncbi:hypothetical protein [Aquimonas voraii]|uniref:Uncharacterized protein n=1 Tax=Aquimonas voraii TaxID=265719 RepID=A0A1G6V1L5_9GAMM|nr:hypothetical protein [Aquimonas voraii]SDD46867.1 hypothetical protein SAMN04488509_102576 [Aquimonas voraii]
MPHARTHPRTPFRALLAAGLLAFLALPPAFAAADVDGGDSGERIISANLMNAIESWSDPLDTLEAAALERYPELIHRYAQLLGRHYRQGLLAHLQVQYPEAYAEITRELPAERTDDAEILAWLMSAREADWQALQAEPNLAAGGLGFAEVAAREFPQVLAEVEAGGLSPAGRGEALLDHVAALGDEDLQLEARRLIGTLTPLPWKNCICTTVLTFPHQPSPWQTEINENHSSSWGSLPKKERQLNYSVSARGAAKDINFYRRSRHNVWEVDRIKGTNYSHMRVRMLCTRNGEPGGVECGTGTCRGDLAVRIAYGSRVGQQVDYGGPWSKEARAVASDWAQLKYDPPGAAPMTTLFSKGVAVSGFTASNWNSQAIIQVLTTAAQVGLVVATDGSAAGALLEGNLVNDTITALFGLVKREGGPSSHHQDMHAAWDTANSSPIALLPNQTHLFELDTLAKVYGRGYGGDSKTWANVDSSAYLTAVTRNYTCGFGTQAPTPRAYWFWSTPGAPHSSSTLQNLVGSYVQTELGVWPSNVTQQVGQFP